MLRTGIVEMIATFIFRIETLGTHLEIDILKSE